MEESGVKVGGEEEEEDGSTGWDLGAERSGEGGST